MVKKTFLLIFAFCTIYYANLGAQYNEEVPIKQSFKTFKPIDLIDLPTGNTLIEDNRGLRNPQCFHLYLKFYDVGGVLGGIKIGITKRVLLGVSYGGQHVIGNGDINWNPAAGVHIRYKLFSETYPMPPAMSIGYNSQGYGAYLPELERYETKATGFYLTASKNTSAFFNVGFHGGINYSPKSKDNDNDINMFAGVHLPISDDLALFCEYDLGNNDNNEQALGSKDGYLNASLRWIFKNHLIFEFSVKDLLQNRKDVEGELKQTVTRELKVTYTQYLLCRFY